MGHVFTIFRNFVDFDLKFKIYQISRNWENSANFCRIIQNSHYFLFVFVYSKLRRLFPNWLGQKLDATSCASLGLWRLATNKNTASCVQRHRSLMFGPFEWHRPEKYELCLLLSIVCLSNWCKGAFFPRFALLYNSNAV